MQSLTYQQSNGFISAALINRAQPKPGVSCGALRDAVRAWSAVAGQDVVTALIVEEWHRILGAYFNVYCLYCWWSCLVSESLPWKVSGGTAAR